MATSTLAHRIQRLTEVIQAKAPGHNARRQYASDLQRMLETGEAQAGLARFAKKTYGIKTLASSLLRAAQADDFALPKALYVTSQPAQARWTETQAIAAFGVRKSTLQAVRALKNLSGRAVGSYSSRLKPKSTNWLASLVQGPTSVIIDREALTGLIMPAIETYEVEQSRKVPYSEVQGLCFGQFRDVPRRAWGRGTEIRRTYHVMTCVAQQRAFGDTDSCQLNEKSYAVQRQIAEAMFPQLQFLGFFHSHPYKREKKRGFKHKGGHRQLSEAEGWRLSDKDVASSRSWVRDLPEGEPAPRIELVVAVGQMDKARRKEDLHHYGRNTVQFIVERHQIILSAWPLLEDGSPMDEARTTLSCWWSEMP